MADYSGTRLDLVTNDNLTDLVAKRFDAGIRFDDILEKDMIAIGMAVVGTLGYFATNSAPESPQRLAAHRCLD